MIVRTRRVGRKFEISVGRVKGSVKVTIYHPRAGVIMFTAKTVKYGGTMAVRIPPPIRRAYGVQPGDVVVLLEVSPAGSNPSISSSSDATFAPLSVKTS